jgi:hypothetical protein
LPCDAMSDHAQEIRRGSPCDVRVLSPSQGSGELWFIVPPRSEIDQGAGLASGHHVNQSLSHPASAHNRHNSRARPRFSRRLYRCSNPSSPVYAAAYVVPASRPAPSRFFYSFNFLTIRDSEHADTGDDGPSGSILCRSVAGVSKSIQTAAVNRRTLRSKGCLVSQRRIMSNVSKSNADEFRRDVNEFWSKMDQRKVAAADKPTPMSSGKMPRKRRAGPANLKKKNKH